MKKNTLILYSLIAMFSFSSCIYIDTDDDTDTDESAITLTVRSPSNNGSITVNERLDIKITVNDNDGIEKVILQIPYLGIDKTYNTIGDDIEINDVFIINENDTKGLATILVKVKDDDNNKTEKSGVILIQ